MDDIWAQDLTVGKMMWYFHITFFPHFSPPSFLSPAVPTFPLPLLLAQPAGWAAAGITGILTDLPPPDTQLLSSYFPHSALDVALPLAYPGESSRTSTCRW